MKVPSLIYSKLVVLGRLVLPPSSLSLTRRYKPNATTHHHTKLFTTYRLLLHPYIQRSLTNSASHPPSCHSLSLHALMPCPKGPRAPLHTWMHPNTGLALTVATSSKQWEYRIKGNALRAGKMFYLSSDSLISGEHQRHTPQNIMEGWRKIVKYPRFL